MLRIYAVTADGCRHILPAPKSLVLCMDEDIPADSLTGVFAEIIPYELCEIYVYDGAELVYSGVVDEQISYVGESVKTQVISRSMAALLIDNEALPKTFVNPSAELIFRRYLKPLGITGYVGENVSYPGEFKVQKGTSCWQVIEDFCRGALGTFPRIRGRVLYFEGVYSDREIAFENSHRGEYRYISLEYNRSRCKLISKVRAKTETGGEYSTIIENKDAVARGVLRERYLNATELSPYTLAEAHRLLSVGDSSAQAVVLHCEKRYTDILGVTASVRCSRIGDIEGMAVGSLRYSLSEKGETTKLTLRKKEN